MPLDTESLQLTGALGVRAKAEAALVLQKIQADREIVDPSLTFQDWLDSHVRVPEVRQLLEAFFRFGTYANDPTHFSASKALEQFRLGASGVLYLNGRWSTLIEALARKAENLGVQIETASSEIGTVLAVPPASVELLTGAKLPPLRPVRAACLDLALSSLPDNAALFAIGLDRPLYFSVHSAIASLAPERHHLVHIARYLAPEEQQVRDELEDFADLLIPGWRSSVCFTRYLPNMTVSHALPTTAGRPHVDAIPGFLLAGDWIGREGMLADAAAAGGLRAARLA